MKLGYKVVKNYNWRMILFIICIFALVLLYNCSAFAEKEWTFKYGKFSCDQFSLDIPDVVSVIHRENDKGIVLKSKEQDIFLAVHSNDKAGLTLDNVYKNLNIKDETYIAALWTPGNLDAISSTWKQTARVDRKNMEILEYRFDAKFGNKSWIAFHTVVFIKDSNRYCEIKLFADSKKAYTTIMYYIQMMDSIKVNTSANLGENEWLCDNCNSVNTGNFCSTCGSQKPGIIIDTHNETAAPVQTKKNNASDVTFKKESGAAYDSAVSVARELAKIIAYNAKAPAEGETVNVLIEGKTVLVHADFKYAIDVYYEFYKEYFDSIKKQDINTMMSLITKIEEVDTAIEQIGNMGLSDGDMAYYMSVYARILKIMGETGNE